MIFLQKHTHKKQDRAHTLSLPPFISHLLHRLYSRCLPLPAKQAVTGDNLMSLLTPPCLFLSLLLQLRCQHSDMPRSLSLTYVMTCPLSFAYIVLCLQGSWDAEQITQRESGRSCYTSPSSTRRDLSGRFQPFGASEMSRERAVKG